MDKILFLRAADRERSKRRAQYRYKTTEHVQNRKHKRDMDGFFIPFAMFRSYNGSGLLCEVLGLTPARRMADLRVLQDYLMKEAYEHAIERMMCLIRLRELDRHKINPKTVQPCMIRNLWKGSSSRSGMRLSRRLTRTG